MLNIFVECLFDFYICKGNLGKWLIARLLDGAAFLFLAVAIISCGAGRYVPGIIGILGTVFFTVLDWKFTGRRIAERKKDRQEKNNP